MEPAMEWGNWPRNAGAGWGNTTERGTGHGKGGNQPWKGEELATERGDWPRNGGTGHGTEELAMERGNWTWNRGTGPGCVCPSPEPCLLGSCFHFALRPLRHFL